MEFTVTAEIALAQQIDIRAQSVVSRGRRRQGEIKSNSLIHGSFHFTRDKTGPNCEISRGVGIPVCEAFVEADKVCAECVELPQRGTVTKFKCHFKKLKKASC